MLMLGAGILCATALAAQAPKNKMAATPAQEAAPAATFVGADTCVTCHDNVGKTFASNPHTKMVEMQGSHGTTCENCHGAGSEHVAGGGDATKIFDPLKASAKDVDGTCLKCHAGAHPNFDGSPHAKANVSCIGCHSIHGGNVQLPSKEPEKATVKLAAAAAPEGPEREYLLKASEPKLCFQCHIDQKPAFSMPFHHPVNEGAVTCSDCHDVHGTFQPNNMLATADANLICTKCHTDKRGPFVFEHMPVKAEGCGICHAWPPHGSQSPRMLNMPNINVLCLQCHSQVAADTVHGISSPSELSVPCTSCHTYIHGSNINAAFLR
jgi:predicted CXXCH cytochrome family protein